MTRGALPKMLLKVEEVRPVPSYLRANLDNPDGMVQVAATVQNKHSSFFGTTLWLTIAKEHEPKFGSVITMEVTL